MSYRLYLTEDDMVTIHFVGGRYAWSDVLMSLDVGSNSISEASAHEIRDAIDEDMEGGHDAFPMLDPHSRLAEKLTKFYHYTI